MAMKIHEALVMYTEWDKKGNCCTACFKFVNYGPV